MSILNACGWYTVDTVICVKLVSEIANKYVCWYQIFDNKEA